MPSTRIVVKPHDGRWTIGREGWPFQAFESKELAIERARLLAKHLREAEIVVQDEPPGEPPRDR